MIMTKCPRCGKLFSKVRSLVCGHCLEDEEADFDRIRQVVQESPDLKPEQVSEISGVTVDCVLRMLKQSRIKASAVLQIPD